jgi:transcriptional regulator with XRE-family HTH domain
MVHVAHSRENWLRPSQELRPLEIHREADQRSELTFFNQKQCGDRMDIGAAIRVARTRRGLKQTDVASRMGVSATYISLLENNQRDPSIGLLKRLADVLYVPLPILFMIAEDMSNTEKRRRGARARGVVIEELLRLLDEGSE